MSETKKNPPPDIGRFAVLPWIEDVLDRMPHAELHEVWQHLQEKYPHRVGK